MSLARSLATMAAPALLATALHFGPAQAQTFDHSGWNDLLKAHVVGGMVDYDAFRSSPAFDAYLARLAAFDPAALPTKERLAFWINAYNAYTIKLILKHDETESIRNINKTLFLKAYGPWKEKLAVVGGVANGLDHIEQDIIRPEFREPRIHFALVCAAMGCPPLRSEAYTGARLDEQLDDQGRTFLLESPTKNRVDVATQTVYLSQVFKFRDYAKDFGGSTQAIGTFIAKWYPAGPQKAMLESGKFTVEYTDYDWSLNSQAHAKLAAARQ